MIFQPKGFEMSEDHTVNRRDFVKAAVGAGFAMGALSGARPARARSLDANDRINLGIIGVGGRGHYLAGVFADLAEKSNVQIGAVCDVYRKRTSAAAERHKCKGIGDYREMIAGKSIDAVMVATPDHWHARIAIEAMNAGKDVYLEKPMCHTIEEAKQVVRVPSRTKRILQVGSQTTSADQWWKAKKAIADGVIGKMLMSQGSYHRNSTEAASGTGTIDPDAGPEQRATTYIDWKMWLGRAPARPWNADRFFRFRKYWDYSGGIATDLFFHVVAPLNICWREPQFPYRVMAGRRQSTSSRTSARCPTPST